MIKAMTVAEYIEGVEAGIAAWFDAQKKTAPTDEARQLLDRMCALILRGGKRARPELLYMTYAAYGGKSFAGLIDLGLALELHHQFLLAHDDLMDNDTVRYGGPNIVGYYLRDKRAGGQNAADAMGILAGDLLFSFSNQIIIDSKELTQKQKISLLQKLQSANAAVAYGQQLDVGNLAGSLSTFSIEKLLQIHSLKSAVYSTRLPMDCAAALLGLESAEREKIAAFAEPFGVLFQLVDDFSDYFVNNSAFNNRPKYRDFGQGKITYPLYIALTLANKKQAAFIHRHLGNKAAPDENVAEVAAMLESLGAKKAGRNYLEKYFTQSLNALNELSISTLYRQKFRQLIEKYRV
jgi:geranylgeranyl pyrophosphate synthase